MFGFFLSNFVFVFVYHIIMSFCSFIPYYDPLLTCLNFIFEFLCVVPSTIVSTVECSYPIPEDASVGFLYIGANLVAIMMTFVGQILLATDSSNPAPFFPYGIWVLSLLFLALFPVLSFQGKYFRLEQDSQTNYTA